MPIRVSIHSRGVKNPLLSFVIAVLGLLAGIPVLALLLFILLPAIWFAMTALLLAITLLPWVLPKVTAKYRLMIRKSDHSSPSG